MPRYHLAYIEEHACIKMHLREQSIVWERVLVASVPSSSAHRNSRTTKRPSEHLFSMCGWAYTPVKVTLVCKNLVLKRGGGVYSKAGLYSEIYGT